MITETLDKLTDSHGPDFESLPFQQFLRPPYGYVIGVVVWSVYLATWYTAVYVTEIRGLLPFRFSVVVALGGLLVTAVISAVAMSITAWRVPRGRIRGHFARVSLAILVVPILFFVYFVSDLSSVDSSGLSVFTEHALLTTGLVGPMIGFAFLLFSLLVLGFRYRLD